MTGTLLARGMLIGLVAGLLAFGFARLIGEPQVDRAIAFETASHAAKGEAPEEEIVSREVQSGLGLFTGVVAYGTAIGGLYALVFAFLYGRVGRLRPRPLAALIALAGFVAIVIVPDLKYPANPPSVGNPDTIGYRTELFFVMIAVSIAAMALTVNVGRRLVARFGVWNATLIAAATFVVIVAVIQLSLPDINEVPAGFPAVVLWRFRVAALGIQAILWTGLGLGFGWLTERRLESQFRFARPAL